MKSKKKRPRAQVKKNHEHNNLLINKSSMVEPSQPHESKYLLAELNERGLIDKQPEEVS